MKRLSRWSLAAAVALLVSCQPPLEPLRIVSSPWPGYEPLYLARDLGYLKESSVRITELPTSNTSFEAFSNGSADVATLTLDETLALLAKGHKLRTLLVIDISNGSDAVVARPEIHALADLKGMRLGMENIPLGAYMLTRMLDVAGLKPADIIVIPMPEDKHEKAYLQDKIDAAITMEPYKSRLVKDGAHVLFDSSMIPNEIFDLVVVREEVYRERRDDLCHLAKVWFRTVDYVRANPQESAVRMGRRLKMDPESFLTAMAGLKVPTREENRHLLSGTVPGLLAPARRLSAVMQREHMLHDPVDIAATIDPGFAECLI
jgi:NitT/TauT family transport system substrate-binding protein